MPHEFNGIIAVRHNELIPIFYKNIDVLKATVCRQRTKSYGIKKLQSGGNGRELLIDFDSLPVEIRQALGDPRKVTNWMDRFFKINDVARAYYGSYRFESGNGLSNQHIEEYTINASTLEACKLLRNAREQERRGKAGSLRGVATTIWIDAMNFRAVQRMKYGFEHTLPSNERRFTEAVRRFEEIGFASVISGKHQNKNAVKVTADVIDLLNNLFAGTHLKPTATEVSRQYMRFLINDLEVIDHETGEVICSEGYPQISDTTILGYLAKWDLRIGTHSKRSGNRQTYMNKFKVYHKLEIPKYSNSIISVDDRNPPFKMADGKRVWFYCGIDLCSEVWVGWVHGQTKEGIIIDFYRQLIRNYAKWGFGLPRELECESSLNAHLRGGILADGRMFEKVRIEANNATGKKIERYFEEMRYRQEKSEEGWIARPFARAEANQVNEGIVPTLTYERIVNIAERAMNEWNNAEHPRYKGKTRLQVHAETQNPKRKPICWEVLLPMIGYETKTSCRNGVVALNGGSFCIANHETGKLASGEYLIKYMKLIEGQKIVVYWLDDAEGEMAKAIVHKDGRLMCELIKQPTYSRSYFERVDSEHGDENYTLMSAYSNTIQQFGTAQRKKISQITILEAVKKDDEEIEVAEVLADLDEEEFVMLRYGRKKKSYLDRF
jgi:hypothetical protein